MAEVTEEQHARAMLRGAWQCPACVFGFQRFEITEDLNICPNCGYHGGAVEKPIPSSTTPGDPARSNGKEDAAVSTGPADHDQAVASRMGDSRP